MHAYIHTYNFRKKGFIQLVLKWHTTKHRRGKTTWTGSSRICHISLHIIDYLSSKMAYFVFVFLSVIKKIISISVTTTKQKEREDDMDWIK